MWISVHVGVVHNEKVDGFAKETTRALLIARLRIPAGDVSTGVKQFEATQRAVTDRGTLFGLNTLVSFTSRGKNNHGSQDGVTQES